MSNNLINTLPDDLTNNIIVPNVTSISSGFIASTIPQSGPAGGKLFVSDGSGGLVQNKLYFWESGQPAPEIIDSGGTTAGNEILVKENAGPGEFSTISAAVTYVNSLSPPPSSSNRFNIIVGPGEYVESPIIVPSFVYISGRFGVSPGAIEVTCNNPTATIFTMNNSTGLSNLIIKDIDSAAASAITLNGTTGNNTTIIIDSVTISSSNPAALGTGIRHLSGGGYITQLKIYGIGRAITSLSNNVLDNVIINGAEINISATSSIAVALNTPSTWTFNDCDLTAAATGQGYFLGAFPARLNISGGSIKSAGVAISIDGTAGAARVEAAGLNFATSNTLILSVVSTTATGSITGIGEASKLSIAAAAQPNFSIELSGNNVTSRGLSVAPEFSLAGPGLPSVNMTSALLKTGALGIVSGGIVTTGIGLQVSVSAGTGYIQDISGNLKLVEWPQNTALALSANSFSYVFVGNSGTVQFSTVQPNVVNNVILAQVITYDLFVGGIISGRNSAIFLPGNQQQVSYEAFGPIYVSGSTVASISAGTQLSVNAGRFSYLSSLYNTTGASPAVFDRIYSLGTITNISLEAAASNLVPLTQYNDLALGLVAIPVGQYVSHGFYVSVDTGGVSKYYLRYGQAFFSSQSGAESYTFSENFTGPFVQLASVVVRQGSAALISIVDRRPFFASRVANTNTGVTEHNQLLGLTVGNDHPQYLLRSGTQPMTGSLDLGGNNIANTGTINSVTVQAHAARHLPSGADPLTTAAPVTIGTANSAGVADSFARSDHIHAHGDQPGGTLHAVATGATAGFMSAADKTTFDARTDVNTASTIVTRSAAGRSDLSTLRLMNTGNTQGVSVTAPGALAASYSLTLPVDDGLSGQTLITDGSGILSWSSVAADALPRNGSLPMTGNLDMGGNNIINTGTYNAVTIQAHAARHLPYGADPLTTAAPVAVGTANSAGVANSFSRSDHVHNHGDQPGGTLHATATGATSGFMSAADKTTFDARTDVNTASTIVTRSAAGRTDLSTLRLMNTGNTQGVSVTAPSALGASYSLTLPVDDGLSGQTLITDGSGILSWQSFTSDALPRNGSLPMTGTLDMGSNNIINAGSINSVTIQAHAARHLPSGADPLATAAPVSISTANSIGTANSFARSDHVHAHGDQPGGTLHAAATSGVSGFMSAADKTTFDARTDVNTASTIVTRSAAGRTDLGSLRLMTNSNSQSATFTLPATLSSSYTLTFPVDDGLSGQTLVTDGLGVLSWSSVAADALPRNGSLPMTGALDMGTNNIISAGTINGVTVQAHASRHLPSGADPLATAAPVTISTANSAGVANSFSRSDHVHAHGNQSGGTLHADASGSASGFMPAADKTKLDSSTASNNPSTLVQRTAGGQIDISTIRYAIPSTANFITVGAPAGASIYTLQFPPNGGSSGQFLTTNGSGTTSWTSISFGTNIQTVGTSNNSGISSNFARDDHVHAHGDQLGGTLHANATSGVSGFMSAADKTTFDARTATNTASTIVARNVAGRADFGSVRYMTSANANAITIQAPTSILADYQLTLPINTGTSGQSLTTDGSGALFWSSNATNALPRDGSQPMTGSLNMGGNAVTNATTYNGVTVEAHAARHLPSGADPLTTAAPVTISTANSIGTANSFARSDHLHAHGDQPGGTLHAVATSGVSGFMSAADKTAFDARTSSPTPSTIMARDSSGGTDASYINYYNGAGTFFARIGVGNLAASYTILLPLTQQVANQALTSINASSTTWTTFTSNNTVSTIMSRDASGDSSLRRIGIIEGGISTTLKSGALSNFTLTFPTGTGTNGQALTTDGTGVTSWTSFVTGTTATTATANTIALRDSNADLTSRRSILNNGSFLTTIEAGATSTWTLTLPIDGGTNGQALVTNGSGITSWANVVSGTAATTPTANTVVLRDSNADIFARRANLRNVSAGTDLTLLADPNMSSSYSLTFPTTSGTAGQLLTTAGPSGLLSWISAEVPSTADTICLRGNDASLSIKRLYIDGPSTSTQINPSSANITLGFPAAGTEIVTNSGVQTLTNKTLTSPAIATATFSGSNNIGSTVGDGAGLRFFGSVNSPPSPFLLSFFHVESVVLNVTGHSPATTMNVLFCRIGQAVTMTTAGVLGTVVGSPTTITTTGIPSRYYPNSSGTSAINQMIAVSNSANSIGLAQLSATTGVFTFFSDISGANFSVGSGRGPFSFSWGWTTGQG